MESESRRTSAALLLSGEERNSEHACPSRAKQEHPGGEIIVWNSQSSEISRSHSSRSPRFQASALLSHCSTFSRDIACPVSL
jgi:hypothetical protein